MLIDSDALQALLVKFVADISALPDSTPVASADDLKAQLDAVKAELADSQKKNSDLTEEVSGVRAELSTTKEQLSALQGKEGAEASIISKVKEDLATV